jgi:hypothetical protein
VATVGVSRSSFRRRFLWPSLMTARLRRSYVNNLLGSLHQVLRDAPAIEQAWSAIEHHLHSLSAIAKLFTAEHAESGRAIFQSLCLISRNVLPFRGMLCTFLLTERVNLVGRARA